MNLLKLIPHKHKFYPVGALGHLMLESGGHTTVVILRCWCSEWYSFPSYNLELALKEGTPETRKVLQSFRSENFT